LTSNIQAKSENKNVQQKHALEQKTTRKGLHFLTVNKYMLNVNASTSNYIQHVCMLSYHQIVHVILANKQFNDINASTSNTCVCYLITKL
jgi:hypothetical protein